MSAMQEPVGEAGRGAARHQTERAPRSAQHGARRGLLGRQGTACQLGGALGLSPQPLQPGLALPGVLTLLHLIHDT